MQQLYTTSEAAKATSIPEGTIRSWLSRYPQAFETDVHLVIQEGKKFWTEQGIELLQSRATENATPFTAKSDADATEDATVVDAKPFHDAIVDGFTDRVALDLAATICQHLPNRTLHHVHRILHSPLPQEKEVMHKSMQQAMQLLPAPGKRVALPQAEEC